MARELRREQAVRGHSRMSKTDTRIDTFTLSPSWESLLLICKDCQHRKDGPKHLKAKALAKEIKHQVKDSAPRARVVLTSCLKLCPKQAISVAFVSPPAKPRIAAIKTRGQLQDTLSELLDAHA
jgi:hypothetical protein